MWLVFRTFLIFMWEKINVFCTIKNRLPRSTEKHIVGVECRDELLLVLGALKLLRSDGVAESPVRSFSDLLQQIGVNHVVGEGRLEVVLSRLRRVV